MVVLTVVGARPQFVKAAVVSRRLRREHREVLLHTGQHYDDDMSARFFRELALPEPDYHLKVGSGSHAEQTAAMLVGIEAAIRDERPDVVLVFGDTNSTLAGALAAAMCTVPVAHVEAGCRSYDRSMPEEINRVVTDRVARLLLCPTATAVTNLAREGIVAGVHHVGDVMLDLLRELAPRARAAAVPERWGLAPGAYLAATIHRAANTDDDARLDRLLGALESLDEPVILPVHPRTRRRLDEMGRTARLPLRLVDPLGYVEMLDLIGQARLVVTDSGGVQKEAFFLGTPCVTLRTTTEWPETVDAGWNHLVGDNPKAIRDAVRRWTPSAAPSDDPFGGGKAAERIVEVLGAGEARW